MAKSPEANIAPRSCTVLCILIDLCQLGRTFLADPHGVPIIKFVVAQVAYIAAVGIHDPDLFAASNAVAPPDDVATIRGPARFLIPLPR